MALIGPSVRNELFFFVFVFGAAMLLSLREWQSASHEKSAKEAAGEAERRLLESQNRRARRWMMTSTIACLTVILVLTADFIYTRANSGPPVSRAIAAVGDEGGVSLGGVYGGKLHLFTVGVGGEGRRFVIIKKTHRSGPRRGAFLR